MPMEFMNGEATLAFDRVTDVEVKKSMAELIETSASITKRISKVEEEINEKLMNISDVQIRNLRTDVDNAKRDQDLMNKDLSRIQYAFGNHDRTILIVDRILRSKLMRFLNFFGKWYVIDNEGIRINPTK